MSEPIFIFRFEYIAPVVKSGRLRDQRIRTLAFSLADAFESLALLSNYVNAKPSLVLLLVVAV